MLTIRFRNDPCILPSLPFFVKPHSPVSRPSTSTRASDAQRYKTHREDAKRRGHQFNGGNCLRVARLTLRAQPGAKNLDPQKNKTDLSRLFLHPFLQQPRESATPPCCASATCWEGTVRSNKSRNWNSVEPLGFTPCLSQQPGSKPAAIEKRSSAR